jgi:hypothetical protein
MDSDCWKEYFKFSHYLSLLNLDHNLVIFKSINQLDFVFQLSFSA